MQRQCEIKTLVYVQSKPVSSNRDLVKLFKPVTASEVWNCRFTFT